MSFRFVDEAEEPASGGKYRFVEEERKKLPGEEFIEKVDLPRQAGRFGLRAIETGMGIPRSLGELGEMPAELLVKGLEKLGIGEVPRKAFETAKKYAPYKLLPTGEDVREFGKNLWGKQFEPKNKAEEVADEIATDFAALAFPLPGTQVKAMRPLFTAVGANIAAEGAEAFGFGKKGKTATKLGTMLLGSLYHPKGAEKYKNMLYDSARKARPEDATVSTNLLRPKLEKITSDLQKGGIAASDKPALDKIKDLEGLMEGAQIPVEQLERFKVKVNEELAGIFQRLEGNKPGIRSAKKNLQEVSKAADDTLALYGKQNPEWFGLYKSANEAHGAIAQSKRVMNFVKRHSRGISKTVLGYLGLEHIAPAVPKIIGTKSIAAGAAGLGIIKAGELVSRISKSPALRRYYTNVLKSAAKEDAVAVRENLKKMEALLEEED